MTDRTHRFTSKMASQSAVHARTLRIFLGVVVLAGLCTAALSVEVNPYAGIEWDHAEQYKMNLHTHTTESDGRMPPEQVIDEYHQRGYDALAITDHNLSTWPWTDYGRDPEELGMLAIPGNELSRHHHTLSLFTPYETEESDHDRALTGVAEAGGLAILCHPAMHWLREYTSGPALQVALSPALRAITEGDFTAEVWFRTTDAGRNIPLGNYSGNYTGALNLELHTNNRVRLFLQPAEKGKTVDLNIEAGELDIDTRDGEWHHLAGLRRGGGVFLYLDGQLAGQKADTAGSFALRGDTLFIGRDTRTGNTVFTGDLSRIRLWRRALDEDEIAATVSGAPVSHEGLLAQYRFTEDGHASFADTAGHPAGPFHASLVGDVSPRRTTEGPQALRSDTGASALRFKPGAKPETASDKVVEHFVALFERHPHLVATEVLNCTRPRSEYPLDRSLWDGLLTALMPARPVWGVAVDDMHSMSHLGGNWVVVPAQRLDERTVRTALTEGAYYFASTRLHEPDSRDVARTPRIERIVHNPDTNEIAIAATVAGKPLPDSAYVWISQGREVHTGPRLPYDSVKGLGIYARAEITGDGGTVYTNPFGFRR